MFCHFCVTLAKMLKNYSLNKHCFGAQRQNSLAAKPPAQIPNGGQRAGDLWRFNLSPPWSDVQDRSVFTSCCSISHTSLILKKLHLRTSVLHYTCFYLFRVVNPPEPKSSFGPPAGAQLLLGINVTCYINKIQHLLRHTVFTC